MFVVSAYSHRSYRLHKREFFVFQIALILNQQGFEKLDKVINQTITDFRIVKHAYNSWDMPLLSKKLL